MSDTDRGKIGTRRDRRCQTPCSTERYKRWLAYHTPLWWKGEVEVRTKEVARLRIARLNACSSVHTVRDRRALDVVSANLAMGKVVAMLGVRERCLTPQRRDGRSSRDTVVSDTVRQPPLETTP